MGLSSVEGSSPVLDLESVTVILGGEKVVNSVSLSVESGEWLSIIGPNGSGKSSLLRAIAGLVSSTGNIVFDDIDLSELAPKERAQTISIVPQIPVVPPRVKVLDYILLGRTPYLGRGFQPTKEDLTYVLSVVENLDLENVVERSLVMTDTEEIDQNELDIENREENTWSHFDGESLKIRMEKIERELIQNAMVDNDGNKKKAAKKLGVKTTALYYKLEKYGLE